MKFCVTTTEEVSIHFKNKSVKSNYLYTTRGEGKKQRFHKFNFSCKFYNSVNKIKFISNILLPPQNPSRRNSRYSLKAGTYCHNPVRKDTF